MKTTFLSILLLALSSLSVFADPPKAPAGKVWVLNHEMSDEFDANSPDITKWSVFDKGNSWNRTAAFDKRIHEAVKDPASDNYYLTMNPMWYYEDERFTNNSGRTYYFAGGGMDTRALQTYGYFEVRLKPSDFPMGSGVFMNSRGTTDGTCNEKYQTELDIIENMGYAGPDAGSWNNFQHVNSHVKPYSDATGTCQQVAYESTNSGVDAKPLAEPLGFNTVGVWWKDANNAQFYNNNKYFGTITPKRPFTLPMPMIIVMETYNWGDNDENNATNPKPVEWMFEDDFRTKEQRAVVFDWVRVWKLIDIDASSFNNATDNVGGLSETITSYPTNSLNATFIYSAQESRNIVATFYNSSGEELAKESFEVNQGIHSIYHSFSFKSDLIVGNDYKIVYKIMNGNAVIKSSTTTVNIEEKPLVKELLSEGIPTSLIPGETSYNIDVKYETDENSTIVVEIRKPDGAWFGGGSTNVTPGNSTATVKVNTSSATTTANNYFYKIYMHRQGMNWQDPLLVSISPTIYFNVEEPIVPSINIVSTPTEINNNETEIDVEFHYETYENGTLNMKLLNPNHEIVAQELRTERIGRRTITRTIDIDSVLTASSQYQLVVQFSPENNSFATIADTISNITVKGNGTSTNNIKSGTEQLKIYPNPATDQLEFEIFSQKEQINKIEVYNLLGKILISSNIENKQNVILDISSLSSGIYIIKTTSSANIYTSNFVKQ